MSPTFGAAACSGRGGEKVGSWDPGGLLLKIPTPIPPLPPLGPILSELSHYGIAHLGRKHAPPAASIPPALSNNQSVCSGVFKVSFARETFFLLVLGPWGPNILCFVL